VIRFFYLCLLRLHPRNFRQQFAEEMLWIFCQTKRPREIALLFSDAFLSLLRQWILRSKYRRRRPNQTASRETVAGVPAFYVIESSSLSIGVLFNGALLSLAAFGVAAFAIAHGGGSGTIRLPRVVIHPADITPAEAMESPHGVARPDATLERVPVSRQPVAHIDPEAPSAVWDRLLSGALQDSHTGALKLSRKKSSSDARNGSDLITQAKGSTAQAAALFSLLDKNQDSKISRDEIPASRDNPLRELLDRADLDEDGLVTAEELEQALRSAPWPGIPTP